MNDKLTKFPYQINLKVTEEIHMKKEFIDKLFSNRREAASFLAPKIRAAVEKIISEEFERMKAG